MSESTSWRPPGPVRSRPPRCSPGGALDVDIGPSTAALAVVEATGPVVAGEVLVLSAPDALSAPPALAVAGTAQVAPALN